VRTPSQHRRAGLPRIASASLATAALASAAIIGASIDSTPAFALAGDPTPPATAPATATLAASAAYAADVVVAVPQTPVVRLGSNHGTVTAGHVVTFTATEKQADGTPIASEPATFYVHTVTGWQKVSSKKLSTAGAATFTFKPNYDHAYRVDFPAVVAADGSTVYNAVKTASLTVHAKPVDIGPQIVAAAAKEKGRPYVFGADGPRSFDCSGLTKYVFAKFGIKLPHKANLQKGYGKRVSRANAKPGDLVFVFSGSYAEHVAIYAGHGMWWEAPHTGANVRHVKIWSRNIEFRHVR
jgi:cell wall-associated NlpC family hydrolase